MPAHLRALILCMGLALGGCATAPPGTEPAPGRLASWQGALTADEWRTALDGRFAPKGAAQRYIEITPKALVVRETSAENSPYYALATRAPAAPKPAPPGGVRFWHTRAELGPAPAGQPLAGLRIALDPGHLGGAWGPLEARSFSVDGRPPVQEGDLALRVAQLLAPRLEALGAQVSFVRDKPGPVSGEKIEDVHPANWAAMQAFLNTEIRARAQRVNDVLRPDVVLCLHLDAVDWPDPAHHTLVQGQHFHILVNGAYLPSEIAVPEQRLFMLERIADGAGTEELALAQAMAESAAPIFGQPPFGYTGANGVALGGNGYVWGRNLLADRLYRCPVIFFEPYVANSVEGYEHIQAGEYAGTRDFNGVPRKNIFEEYGDAVVAGLVNYYGHRPAAAATK